MVGFSLMAIFLLPFQNVNGNGHERRSLTDSMVYEVSVQVSATAGDNTPLWINANKHGLSSLENGNGYVRASLSRPLSVDSERRCGVGYGVDLVGAVNYNSAFIVQQAYVEGRWLHGVLTAGSKQWAAELKNNELSSGAQTLGINARPVPQLRLALPEYWSVPFTNGWLSLKGHIAYGMTTDGNWQEDFTSRRSKYTTNTFYHSKAGYIAQYGWWLPPSPQFVSISPSAPCLLAASAASAMSNWAVGWQDSTLNIRLGLLDCTPTIFLKTIPRCFYLITMVMALDMNGMCARTSVICFIHSRT